MSFDHIPDEKLKETVIWLAGLISTDGYVQDRRNNTLSIVITSVEIDWIWQIKNRLLEVGIHSTVSPDKRKYVTKLVIKNPFDIRNFLLKYAEPYMMKRKFELIKRPYSKKHKFSIEERETMIRLRTEGTSYYRIGKITGRTMAGVRGFLIRNKITIH